jgi:DNA-binding IclR family transcriptional regulator
MLSERGFAAQPEPAHYVAGGALQRLAGRLNSHLPWANLAGPLLRHLSDSFSETAFLNLLVRERLSRFVVLSTQPPIPLRYAIDINEWVSLLWGAGGRAILAHLTAEEIAAATARNDPSPFGGQPVDPRELHRSLAAARNVGYSLVRSHRQRDAVGVAVPFFDATGEVMGSIGLTLPAERFQERNLSRYAAALIKAASSLSTKLGRDPA